jgi:nicotinate phosphoribosyltransferase
MEPVVRSLLETDLYKFTMQQVMLHRHPAAHAVYEFTCRNTPAFPLAQLEAEVNRELDALCALRFREDELDWLRARRYLKSDYVDFLSLFHFQRKFIEVKTEGEHLSIVARGPQIHVMGFEIFVLYIVSELYMRRLDPERARQEGMRRAQEKVRMLKEFGRLPARRHPFEFFDYGLRRRHSAWMQDHVIALFQRELPEFFKGTSNCFLAKRYGLTAIGSQGHEFLQMYQGLGVRLRDFQKAALEDWVQEYRGDLGTVLTDVVGIDAFLADFDRYHGLLWDAVRHDSGDPFVWGEKMLAKYAELRIDAQTKRLVFSDSLDFPKAFALHEYFGDRAMNGFGIGTHLTNDTGIEPLNLVMKLVQVNGQAVAKLSDSPGKMVACHDPAFLAYLRQVFNKHD